MSDRTFPTLELSQTKVDIQSHGHTEVTVRGHLRDGDINDFRAPGPLLVVRQGYGDEARDRLAARLAPDRQLTSLYERAMLEAATARVKTNAVRETLGKALTELDRAEWHLFRLNVLAAVLAMLTLIYLGVTHG